jgi:hypothetical protein
VDLGRPSEVQDSDSFEVLSDDALVVRLSGVTVVALRTGMTSERVLGTAEVSS